MSKRFQRLEIRHDPEEDQHESESTSPLAGTPVRDADYYMRCAVEAEELGRFETALQMYTRALRQERALIPAWVGQVQMLVQLDEYQEARLWSDKALELFERGVSSLKNARRLLDDAELTVKRVLEDADGTLSDEDLDL